VQYQNEILQVQLHHNCHPHILGRVSTTGSFHGTKHVNAFITFTNKHQHLVAITEADSDTTVSISQRPQLLSNIKQLIIETSNHNKQTSAAKNEDIVVLTTKQLRMITLTDTSISNIFKKDIDDDNIQPITLSPSIPPTPPRSPTSADSKVTHVDLESSDDEAPPVKRYKSRTPSPRPHSHITKTTRKATSSTFSRKTLKKPAPPTTPPTAAQRQAAASSTSSGSNRTVGPPIGQGDVYGYPPISLALNNQDNI
jgi:hypothetical protein